MVQIVHFVKSHESILDYERMTDNVDFIIYRVISKIIWRGFKEIVV